MRMYFLRLRFFLLILWPVLALATPSSSEVTFRVFPISTEIEIGRRLQSILAHAPAGSLVTVGSERGLREAGMLPDVEDVFLVDIADEVLKFLEINLKLLRTPNLEHYKHLRWTATLQEWQKTSPDLSAADFAWWEKYVRNLDTMFYRLPEELNRYGSVREIAKFVDFQKRLQAGEKPTSEEVLWWVGLATKRPALLQKSEELVDLGQVLDYKTGNYLFDPAQYAHLHRLVMAGRIIPLKLNLTKPQELARLKQEITSRKTRIAVLDLDNLYWRDYTKPAEYQAILDTLLPLGENDSLLVVMNNSKDYAGGQMQTYIGFTFENVREWPELFELDSYFDTLPPWIFDFLDGRLYRRGEMPPLNFIGGPTYK